jgi:eukaryotic-like serine/threonine-protein kinase
MVGETLKHYEIEELLGKGGMGTVYRARDKRLGRAVAIKVLNPDMTASSDRRRRFLQEARAASAVTHPSIAQIYDVDESEGRTFIAMELVEGQTVRQLVTARDVDLLVSLEIAIQVAEGLAKAHQAGIVHRDIKSDNIMVTPEGHAKILDFGLAKPLAGAFGNTVSQSGSGQLSRLDTLVKTQVGTVVGTIAYMSPEQARGRDIDHRSDIFSLGVVLYEMATGRLPFAGQSLIETMHAIAYEETRPVTAFRENLPRELQRIVAQCLKKQPEDRYKDAAALVSDLKKLKRDTESGITRGISLGDRVREQIDSLKQFPPSSYAWGAIGLLLTLLLLYWISTEKGPNVPLLLLLSALGLIGYRRLRNRRRNLLKVFVTKASKIAEIRMIVFRDNCATVLVDRAQPRLYVHLNSMMDSLNRKLYFGEHMTVMIKEHSPTMNLRELLEGPGVLYVREDALENAPPGA